MIPMYLQPYVLNLWYFKLGIFNPTELIVELSKVYRLQINKGISF